MHRSRILDEDRPAPGRAPRLRVGVGIADHPATGEVDVESGGSLQQHPRLRLPALACSCERRVNRVGVVQAVAVVVDRDSTLRKQSNDALVGFEEVLMRSLSLRRARLVRDNDGTVIERSDTTDRVSRIGNEPHVAP